MRFDQSGADGSPFCPGPGPAHSGEPGQVIRNALCPPSDACVRLAGAGDHRRCFVAGGAGPEARPRKASQGPAQRRQARRRPAWPGCQEAQPGCRQARPGRRETRPGRQQVPPPAQVYGRRVGKDPPAPARRPREACRRARRQEPYGVQPYGRAASWRRHASRRTEAPRFEGLQPGQAKAVRPLWSRAVGVPGEEEEGEGPSR